MTNFPFTLSDKAYAIVKWFVAVVMPAFSSLYFGLGNIYEWANVENVIGTSALITTFLGAVMGLSSKQYNKSVGHGDIVVREEDGQMKQSLQLEKTPEELAELSKVIFQVVHK